MKNNIVLLICMLICSIGFSQTVKKQTIRKTSGVKANPLQTLKSVDKDLKDEKEEKEEKKVTHIYLIIYKDKNGSHVSKPRKAYRREGESTEDVKKQVALQEQGRKYKLVTYSSVNEDRPYGVLYKKVKKDGKVSYLLGTYTTQAAADKKCDDVNRYGNQCVEVFSLN